MGCDYYVYTDLYIEFYDGSDENITLYSKQGYFYYNDDESIEDQERNILQSCKTEKILYDDYEWTIKNTDIIEEYKTIMKKTVKLECIRRITKISYATPR